MITIHSLITYINKYNQFIHTLFRIDPIEIQHIIDPNIALHIYLALLRRTDISRGIKLSKKNSYCNSSAYLFMKHSTKERNEYHILIKGNIKARHELTHHNPYKFIGIGSSKIVKKSGGLLIVLNEAKEYLTHYPLVTISRSTSETFPGHKFASFNYAVAKNPLDYFFYDRLYYLDPIRGQRLICYEKMEGPTFNFFQGTLTQKQSFECAWLFLNDVKRLLNESIWPVDLKPSNTCVSWSDGILSIKIIDFIGHGATFTPFKNQFKRMEGDLKKLLTLQKEEVNDCAFFAHVEQLIFEISHMMFLFFNPDISEVSEACYLFPFRESKSSLECNVRQGKNNVYIEIFKLNLGEFFKSMCYPKTYHSFWVLPIMYPPNFRAFLVKLKQEFIKAINPELHAQVDHCLNDRWMDEFSDLINNFRTSKRTPVGKQLITINLIE